MKPKLIALDIDGTILDMPTRFYVPAAVRETVNEARKKGICVCLCSSRPCFSMGDATQGLDEIDALIGCSGAVIEAGGKAFYIDTLPYSLIQSCLAIAKENDLHISYAGEDIIYVLKDNNTDPGFQIDPELESDPNFAVLEEDRLINALNNTYVTCAFIFLKPGMPDETLTEAPALSAATIHRAGYNCFVITNKGTDKGSGVLRLAAHYGIPQEAILAVGNDENDIPMLEIAGISVAVANASHRVLAVADWVAPSVYEAGAAEAIRRFAL